MVHVIGRLLRTVIVTVLVVACSSCPSKSRFSVTVMDKAGVEVAEIGHLLYYISVNKDYVVSIVPPVATITSIPGNLSNDTTTIVKFDSPGVYYIYITDYDDVLDRITLIVD